MLQSQIQRCVTPPFEPYIFKNFFHFRYLPTLHGGIGHIENILYKRIIANIGIMPHFPFSATIPVRMSHLPTVAIVGRPNTGKSRLFNRIIGQRKAIVSDIPGTTRDQVASKVETDDVDYLLVDTGGMGGGTTDTDFEDDVRSQPRLAIEHAD